MTLMLTVWDWLTVSLSLMLRCQTLFNYFLLDPGLVKMGLPDFLLNFLSDGIASQPFWRAFNLPLCLLDLTLDNGIYNVLDS